MCTQDQEIYNREDSQNQDRMMLFLGENPGALSALVHSLSVPDSTFMMFIGNLQTNWFYISDNMKETFGFEDNLVENLLEKWEKNIFREDDLAMYRTDIQEILGERKEEHSLYYRVRDVCGNEIWIHCRGVITWNAEKTKPLYFAGCVSRQEFDFVVDTVTNLPRENGAVMKLNRLTDKGVKITVLGICLRNFSDVNDLLGVGEADEIVQEIVGRWIRTLDHEVSFFRLEGLRFLAIIRTAYSDRLNEQIGVITKCVEEVYHKHSVSVHYPCSVCVLEYPTDADTPLELLERATSLMDYAQTKPGEIIWHDGENFIEQKTRAQMVLSLTEDVLNDFRNFRVVVQPIVSTDTGTIVGGEALLRWKYQGKDISPMIFIPILEKNKLILRVGRWVFEQAVKHCKVVHQYLPEFHISVNVSYHQILDDAFFPFLQRTIQRNGIHTRHITLELTETNFDEMPEKLKIFFYNCKGLGLTVALDDFGNGYSSLGMLMKYPAKVIKLDRSILHEITRSETKQKFITSIVFACHQFEKEVCIEGVETAEAVEIIRQTGCDMIQGYYFYRPLEVEKFYEACEIDAKK